MLHLTFWQRDEKNKSTFSRHCAAKLTLATRSKACRLESCGTDIAHITTHYYEVEGNPYVLELVQRTPGHTTLDNLHPATTVSVRINGLTGNAADYKLFALGTDGRCHEVSDWHFDDAPARLSAKKVYTICLTVQDGGSFDLSPDAKEVTLSVVLAR